MSGTDTIRPRRIWTAGLAATGAAVVADLAVHTAGTGAGVDFTVHPDGSTMEVGAGMIAAFAAVAMLLGTVLARLLARRGRHGLRAAQVIGAVIAVVSLLLPLTVSATLGTRLLLAVMHLVAGAAYVIALQIATRNAEAPTAGRVIS